MQHVFIDYISQSIKPLGAEQSPRVFTKSLVKGLSSHRLYYIAMQWSDKRIPLSNILVQGPSIHA